MSRSFLVDSLIRPDLVNRDTIRGSIPTTTAANFPYPAGLGSYLFSFGLPHAYLNKPATPFSTTSPCYPLYCDINDVKDSKVIRPLPLTTATHRKSHTPQKVTKQTSSNFKITRSIDDILKSPSSADTSPVHHGSSGMLQ